jgi:hypothetical protein
MAPPFGPAQTARFRLVLRWRLVMAGMGGRILSALLPLLQHQLDVWNRVMILIPSWIESWQGALAALTPDLLLRVGSHRGLPLDDAGIVLLLSHDLPIKDG